MSLPSKLTRAVPIPELHRLYQRGETAVKKSKLPVVPNIVETYKLGNATIHICDNFIRTDPAEIEKVLDDFHAAGWAIIDELREKGEDI